MTLILKHSDFEAFHFVSTINDSRDMDKHPFYPSKEKGVTLGVKIGLEPLLGFRS